MFQIPSEDSPLQSSPAELQRAARTQLRHLHAGQLPWLVPVLVVSDQGAVGQRLVDQLSDVPGTSGDPQFALLAHAHAWNATQQAQADDATALARAIQSFLTQPQLHQARQTRAWRWPVRPGLVIVAAGAAHALTHAAVALCPADAVLAVYAVDDFHSSGVARCETMDHHAPLDDEPPSLQYRSPAELCARLRLDILQRLLREAPTPTGQHLQAAFAERLVEGRRSPAFHGGRT